MPFVTGSHVLEKLLIAWQNGLYYDCISVTASKQFVGQIASHPGTPTLRKLWIVLT